MDQNSSTTAPETRGSDLSPQTRVGADQPGNEQVRRGQVRVRPRYKYLKKCSKFLSRNSQKFPKFLKKSSKFLRNIIFF